MLTLPTLRFHILTQYVHCYIYVAVNKGSDLMVIMKHCHICTVEKGLEWGLANPRLSTKSAHRPVSVQPRAVNNVVYVIK